MKKVRDLSVCLCKRPLSAPNQLGDMSECSVFPRDVHLGALCCAAAPVRMRTWTQTRMRQGRNSDQHWVMGLELGMDGLKVRIKAGVRVRLVHFQSGL